MYETWETQKAEVKAFVHGWRLRRMLRWQLKLCSNAPRRIGKIRYYFAGQGALNDANLTLKVVEIEAPTPERNTWIVRGLISASPYAFYLGGGRELHLDPVTFEGVEETWSHNFAYTVGECIDLARQL